MCAIIGAVGKIPEREKVIRARDTMTHRGPDDAGIYYAPEEGVALGHRRLAIIDLSPAGRQPMQSADGRFVVSFNGEIYNYQALRSELRGKYQFSTETDTETILAAFSVWGVSGVERLRGMFAFSVWDRKAGKCYLVRDRLGIKPIYFAEHAGNFYFSSEIKGILALSGIPRKLNAAAFIDYLSYRYPLGGKTFFEGIYSVLPGQMMTIAPGGKIERTLYWDIPVVSDKKERTEDEVLSETERILKEAVRLHLQSDVPVGAYLSGGVDSSLLVALMSELAREPIKTFSVGFPEREANEFGFAREVAERYGTEHREIELDAKNYLALLPEVIRFKDAPLAIPNEVPLHVLSSELKKHITVVLSGEGADELFGGYGRIFRSGFDWDRMSGSAGLPLSDREWAELKKNLTGKYGDVFPKTITEHFTGEYSYMPLSEKRALVSGGRFDLSRHALLNEAFFENFFRKTRMLSSSEQYLCLFEKVHIIGPLERLDTTTMSRSVEARVPYVDHELVEFVSALPLSFKLRWNDADSEAAGRVLNADQISETYDTPKYVLRKLAEKYLPANVINRKKMGFPVPLNAWTGGELSSFTRDILLAPDARSRGLYNEETLERFLAEPPPAHGRRGMNIWMLVNLELWASEYKVAV